MENVSDYKFTICSLSFTCPYDINYSTAIISMQQYRHAVQRIFLRCKGKSEKLFLTSLEGFKILLLRGKGFKN